MSISQLLQRSVYKFANPRAGACEHEYTVDVLHELHYLWTTLAQNNVDVEFCLSCVHQEITQ